MPRNDIPGLLHVLPAGGGGTERYVRDVVAGLPHYRHRLLHVGANAAAFLTISQNRFEPLALNQAKQF